MPPVSCGKKTFPFLSLWRCWAAHYSCGYFNVCGNTERTHTPGTSSTTLFVKQDQWKHSARQRSQHSNISRVSFSSSSSALTSFDKSLGKGKDRHGWVKWCEGILCVSHGAGASPAHSCRQVSLTASCSSLFVIYRNVPLGFHVY